VEGALMAAIIQRAGAYQSHITDDAEPDSNPNRMQSREPTPPNATVNSDASTAGCIENVQLDGGVRYSTTQKRGLPCLPKRGGVAYAAQETWLLNDSIRVPYVFIVVASASLFASHFGISGTIFSTVRPTANNGTVSSSSNVLWSPISRCSLSEMQRRLAKGTRR
jgi:hypothetical protein